MEGLLPAVPEERVLASGRGEQLLPRMAPAGEGRFWLSWFDREPGGYRLRLNLLSRDGEPLLGARGLLVSDWPQQTWLLEYSLCCDGAGQATLLFDDIRRGTRQVQGQRVSPAGAFLWGPDGVTLSDDRVGVGPPRAVLDADGDALCAWSGTEGGRDVARLQRISAGGVLPWGVGILVRGAEGAGCYWPVLVRSGAAMILVWEEASRSTSQTDRVLRAQAFDGRGREVWPAPAVLSRGMQVVHYRPPLVAADGRGGVWAGWQAVSERGLLQGRLQHLDARGVPSLPFPGIPLGPCAEVDHILADLAAGPEGREGFAFWKDFSDRPGRKVERLRLEGVSMEGARRWGGEGLPVPSGTSAPLALGLRMEEGRLQAFTMDFPYSGFLHGRLSVAEVPMGGGPPSPALPLTASRSAKVHPVFQVLDRDRTWAVWEDARGGPTALHGTALVRAPGLPPPSSRLPMEPGRVPRHPSP